MDYYLTNYPLTCIVLLGGIIACWLFWLFLAFGIYSKNKKNEFTSFSRKLLPLIMIILPLLLLGIFIYLNTEHSKKAAAQTEAFVSSVTKELCYINEEGASVPIIDGKYVLYRKYANGSDMELGIITMLPDLTLRSFPLNISGTLLKATQPHEAYTMIAYGVHNLPDFHGLVLTNNTTKEGFLNSSILANPYTGNGRNLATQAFPYLYVEVAEGKGSVQIGYLTRANAGDAVKYYGTWLEPIIASYVLYGFSVEHINKIVEDIQVVSVWNPQKQK